MKPGDYQCLCCLCGSFFFHPNKREVQCWRCRCEAIDAAVVPPAAHDAQIDYSSGTAAVVTHAGKEESKP